MSGVLTTVTGIPVSAVNGLMIASSKAICVEPPANTKTSRFEALALVPRRYGAAIAAAPPIKTATSLELRCLPLVTLQYRL